MALGQTKCGVSVTGESRQRSRLAADRGPDRPAPLEPCPDAKRSQRPCDVSSTGLCFSPAAARFERRLQGCVPSPNDQHVGVLFRPQVSGCAAALPATSPGQTKCVVWVTQRRLARSQTSVDGLRVSLGPLSTHQPSSLRTLGTATANAAIPSVPAVAIQSVMLIPIEAASGPATMYPSGWNASEPNQS